MAILGDTKATSLVVSGTSTLASINANSTGLGTDGQILKSTGTGIAWVNAASSHTHSQYYDANTSRTKNTVLAAPNGSNGAATFRALVAADLPGTYAGSSSAGGAANSLANFKVTTSTSLWAVDSPTTNAVGYQAGLTKAAWNYQQTDGALYDQFYSSSWIHQIFGDYRTGQISVRGKNNGTWQAWRRVLDETNASTILGLGTLATKSSISDHSVTTPTGATSRTADVALNTTTVNSITAVGTLPSLTVTATDVVTGGTTTDIPNISKKTVVTGVTKKTVVTGGSTTDVPNITKKTVVTSATAAKATYSNGVLTISDGSVTTGDSVTVGTAIKAYTSLTTGDSVTVTTGDSVTVGTAIKAYTALTTSSIGSASGWSAGTLPTKGSNTTVATTVKTQPTFSVTTQTTTLSHTIS